MRVEEGQRHGEDTGNTFLLPSAVSSPEEKIIHTLIQTHTHTHSPPL